ncbi:GGDEF domain-containing protein, partial [Oxalobacteraceae bacterium OM1]
MELFALSDRVSRLEAQLSAAHGVARLHTLVELAWHLRQRDTRRTIALAEEAEALFDAFPLPESERAALTARLQCIRGEAERLFGELDAAQELADRSLAAFTTLNDGIGCSDAYWLLAGIAGDRGDATRRDACLEKASLRAHAAGDALRASVAE